MVTGRQLWCQLDGWLPRLAPVLAIALGLAVNLLAIDMAAEVFMMVLVLVLFLGLMSRPWHFLVRVWLPPNACPKNGERLQTPCFFWSAPVKTSDFFLPLSPLSMEHLYGSIKSQTIPRLPFLVALPWSVPHFPMAWAHTFESSEQSKDWAETFGACRFCSKIPPKQLL